jgi:uncharacterized protein YndB with AHSA1/START domain
MQSTTADRSITLSRSLRAPPEMVWKAWTDPDSFRRWMGPVGWDITDCTIDLRPGGEWSTTQRSPDGGLHPTGGRYLLVDRPHHLVFNWILADANGTVVMEAEHHLHLAASKSGTELTLEIRIITAGPGSEGFLSGVRQGWTGTLGKLATFLGE